MICRDASSIKGVPDSDSKFMRVNETEQINHDIGAYFQNLDDSDYNANASVLNLYYNLN